MIPVIALVGRPNVGKSTLFNRLTRTREALVADFAGLTRDRKYGEAMLGETRCMLIDTGGITGFEEGIEEAMAEQSLKAIDEADAVIFMVDARQGLTSSDERLAAELRKKKDKVFLVANKVDGVDANMIIGEFYRLGLGDVYQISASHGRGVTQLAEEVASSFPEALPIEASAHEGIRIAVIGRPNVGKSTLVNRLLGEDRVVVYDQPGTTRDSVYIDYERNGEYYTLIDTAGIRRRKNISLSVEKFSIVKTLQAIDDANVVILLMDAQEGVVDQDLHLMGQVLESGRALVVALNKWDGMDPDDRDWVKTELDRRLRFIDFADVHFISALHGTGVGHLYDSIHKAYQSAMHTMSTSRLTRILEDSISEHPLPLVRGRRIKLRYAHTGGHNPPIIVIHGNQVKDVPGHYVRYLEKKFREALDLHGTPVKLEFRSGENPFEGRKNKLTQRQISKKRRMMKHVKKKK
ncbi:MAG: ribosome biogenesis GTPase Der [Porticoccaceae bacterium]